MELPERPKRAELGAGSLETLWLQVLASVRSSVRREQFETWFLRTALVGDDGTSACVAVSNGFTRDWLQTYYLEVLTRAVEEVLGAPRRIEILVDAERVPAGASPLATPEEKEPPRASTGVPPVQPKASGEQSLLGQSDITLHAKYRFDNFVVGPCNRFAHAACVGVSEKPGQLYNPLFLHGNVGLGKTHLMQSVCRSLLDHSSDARILFLSCETFVNHFISALENGDLQRFRTKYRNVDLLVVDDIHILANKERTQEEFFHTFNTLYNAGKQIVLSSDSPPVDIPTLQNRLVSRFKWGLVTEIEPPCYETRMAILKRKSRERAQELPDDVARLLAERVDSNVRELEGAVNRVLGYATLSSQPVTTSLARQCLQDLFKTRRGAPSIDDITSVVTEHFGVKLPELQSKRRTQAIAFPRQVGMYLARRLTSMSLEEIGGFFGGRDHSTVLYGCQKIGALQKVDASTAELLAELTEKLRDHRDE